MKDRFVRRLLQIHWTLALAVLAGHAYAQGPRLERIERAGGQRGTEFEIICHGEQLGTVNDVLFYDSGLALKEIRNEDSMSVAIRLEASADCLPGEYPLRLLSPTGVSELRTIHVSPYTQSDEAEPNNSPEDAQKVKAGVTVHGLVDEGDSDLYRISLNKGQRIAAEVVGIRNTQYVFDSRLAVLDETGKELVAVDDSTLLLQDPMLSFVAPEAGDYFIAIREAAFGGDLDSVYQLHIGEHPRPTVCYPAGGMAGSEQTVTLIGDAKGPIVITHELSGPIGTASYYPQDDSGIAPPPVRLRVSPFPNTLELEPNDSSSKATPATVSLPVALNGVLQEASDVDQFRFRATAGKQYDVNVFGQRIGAPIDSVVSISTADGELIVTNDDGANHDSHFRFTPPKTGEYLIAIRDHLGHGGPEYVYRVEFQPVEAKLELNVPIISETKQQLRQKIELARGGRMALVVSARRHNFLSEVELHPSYLPEGVTVTASRIPGSSHLGYILFEASEDAPLTSDLFGINGVSTVDNLSVHGRLRQETGLAFGPPRRTVYHAAEVDRIPITVLEHGPFQLTVEEPKVPLAIDGQLDLNVTAKRHNYDGEIRLTLPILPPWIEVPEDGVVIPEGKDSATFTVTSTGDADTHSWTILMMGEGNIDGHEVFASSQEFSFDVVNPYLDVDIQDTVVQQGQATQIHCTSKWMQENVEGLALARLRGLPKHVDVKDVMVPAGTKSFTFDVAVGAETPASLHNTLFVEVEVQENGGAVRHFLGRGGVLEVLAEGQKPRDSRSRLDVLRAQAKQPRTAAKLSVSE